MFQFRKAFGISPYSGKSKRQDFNLVIEKIQRRMSARKGKLLDKAGRMTLTKYVLIVMPIYNMQTVLVPEYDLHTSFMQNFVYGIYFYA